jgi:hypothetical protein
MTDRELADFLFNYVLRQQRAISHYQRGEFPPYRLQRYLDADKARLSEFLETDNRAGVSS